MKALMVIPVVGLYLATWVLALYLFYAGSVDGGIFCALFVLILSSLAIKGSSGQAQQVSYAEFQSLRESQTTNLKLMAQRLKEMQDKHQNVLQAITVWQRSMENEIAKIEERL